MEMAKSIEEFIESLDQYRNGVELLRSVLRDTELGETLKWGIPTYTVQGKNIIGIGAFKAYFGIWFYQGSYLSDPAGVLLNAQEGKTKALRQWRFTSEEEIDIDLLRSYIDEAIQNQKDGKELKVTRKPLLIPSLLENELNNNSQLKNAFEQFVVSKKREFAEYISDAKREDTKIKRLQKIIPMILEGIGLNDKYR